ncbi:MULTISPECIES: helix-turn-helix domain-containing protein [Bradyrhizobium]|uniref:helix-turn-helix domain-containing protein n=1 Tax=Bradyrhizobium TaxID=374 RepID=UPI001AD62663|nr:MULTISPECIES: helix-turn-helix transcriptional regulator [Bradyrhizobium]MBO4228398.1 helix-turn-helix domain-containing protein [Bradyrhizobium neotropicale]MCA1455176.1 helix-turn-helix transcriptional regulator [Bradyrhizobium sp. BRP22]
MSYESEELVHEIQSRRAKTGMSQRALADRTGLSQAHISQMETGRLEPGLSSFLRIARALDLEVVLVPKKFLPAVEGIIRQPAEDRFSPEQGEAALREIERGERLVIKLKHLYGSSADLDRIAESLRFFKHAPLRQNDLKIVVDAINKLKRYQASPQSKGTVAAISRELRDLRNHLVHNPSEAPRSAYAVDDEDDDA